MAYYQKLAGATTSNQFLIDLAAFVAANGWIVDLNGIYNTNYRRLHFHQGAAHFDIYSNSTLGMGMHGCTGFNGGLAPNLQPGATPAKLYQIIAGSDCWMISVTGGIYICVLNNVAPFYWFHWCCFFIVQDKVGSWLDGFGLSAGSIAELFNGGWCLGPGYGQMYINGEWSATVAAAGVSGNKLSSHLPTKSPNYYNGGLVPMPILLLQNLATDTSKRVPLGYAPGIYQTNGGDIYQAGDELVIGADTYLITPSYQYATTVGVVQQVDFLFKLGA